LAVGIAAGSPYTVLNVNTLDRNISPASGVDGIYFSGFGPLTTNADTGQFSILSNGFLTSSISVLGSSAVEVNFSGRITSQGNSSYGIYATSTSGPVSINSRGDISVNGNNSYGIFASSPAGVSITVAGNVIAAERGGVFAQSVGGNATVTVLGTVVGGGSHEGFGVAFKNGVVNTLINFGSITASSGIAVRDVTDGANGIINNYGTVTGDIYLGTGTNAFVNFPSGVFNSGATLDLHASNTLTNAGVLSPGGVGYIQSTALTGNLHQISTGHLAVDVNMATATADSIMVTGTATLAGTIVVTPTELALGPLQATILSAAGGTTTAGLTLAASPALQARLLYPNATDVMLATNLNFAFSGLSPNQSAIGNHLNAAVALGTGSRLGSIYTGLLNVLTLPEYKNALDQLSPGFINELKVGSIHAGLGFTSDLLSCPVRGDGSAIVREGQCIWARSRARQLDVGSTSDTPGFRERSASFSTGAQVAIAPEWRFGFAAGHETTAVIGRPNALSEGDRINVGGVLKYNPGQWQLAASASASWSSFDTSRILSFGGFHAAARSSNEIDYLSGRLHAAYLMNLGNLYLKPIVEGGLMRLSLSSFAESDAGGAGLVVEDSREKVWSLLPAIEIGSRINLDQGLTLQPFVRGGVIWFSNGEFGATASFKGSPAGVAPFTIPTKMDALLAEVGAGIDIQSAAGTMIRLSYEGRLSEYTNQHSFGLKVSIPF
jgi:hypothetical protein